MTGGSFASIAAAIEFTILQKGQGKSKPTKLDSMMNWLGKQDCNSNRRSVKWQWQHEISIVSLDKQLPAQTDLVN